MDKKKKLKLTAITLISASVLGAVAFGSYSLYGESDTSDQKKSESVLNSKKEPKKTIKDVVKGKNKEKSVVEQRIVQDKPTSIIDSVMNPPINRSYQNEKEQALAKLDRTIQEDREKNRIIALADTPKNEVIPSNVSTTPDKPEKEKDQTGDKGNGGDHETILPEKPVTPVEPIDPEEKPEIVPTDYTQLLSYYGEAKNIQLNLYLSSSIEHFSNEMLVSERILTDLNATQTQVDNQVQRLQKAVANLILKGDKTNLNLVLSTFNQLDKEIYTTESLAVAEQAKIEAEAIQKNSEVSQVQVDEVAQALQKAINQLTKKDEPFLSLVYLNRAIVKAEALNKNDYTPNSYVNLTMELENAKEIVSSENPTKQEVQTQLGNLNHAIDQLVRKADKTKLNILLNFVATIDRTVYTLDSLEKLDQMVLVVQEKIIDENISQNEVNQLSQELENSIKNLEILETENTEG